MDPDDPMKDGQVDSDVLKKKGETAKHPNDSHNL